MKKTLSVLLLLFVCMTVLVGCGCEHEWVEADCVKAKHCALCNKTEGEPLPHVWFAATCEAPQTCSGCGATEGEALGHSWVEATCEEAKNCTLCHLTEGEALGHSWQEATTEAPKTCEICAVTEGEKIVTDPRFTTASTAALQGNWKGIVDLTGKDMGMGDFPGILQIAILMNFGNAGTLSVNVELVNTDAFLEEALDYCVEAAYAAAEADGLSREELDDAVYQNSQMSTREFVRSQLNANGTFSAEYFNTLLDNLKFDGVYYIDGSTLYTGTDWDSVAGDPFILEGDALQISELNEEFGQEVVFTRAAE